MSELHLAFSPNSSEESGSFRLLELPPDLCKLVESATDELSLCIKGNANEDAVLCTSDQTYVIRSVVLSNSVLVVTPTFEENRVIIRDQRHEILEVVPSVPRLHKLGGLLRGREYDEGHEDDDEIVSDDEGEGPPSKRARLTYQDALTQTQASDNEFARGIKDRRILSIDGHLRPISPSYLTTVLELLLNCLVSLSQSHKAASVDELTAALENDHEIKGEVALQVMAWFGEINLGTWKMDVDAVLKQVGLGILRTYRNDPIPEDEFLRKWKSTAGDTFASQISLALLSGNYLCSSSPHSHPPMTMLSFFPCCELPIDPTARFCDLFLTRSRWRAQDICPFLDDIAVNSKERDKLLLKFARAITDSEGIWYTARSK